ncbi:MAG: hypothetical protein HUJ76_07490, partial [Parasporobacterium sp.]|nr:hypothetical protein [Parasporobacterium sp.]
TFYECTFKTVKKIDPDIRFCSPNFSFPAGLDWYRDFFSYASAVGIHPDFLCIHLYGSNDGLVGDEQEFIRFHSFNKEYSLPNIKPMRNAIPEAIDAIKGLISGTEYADLPIIINDWNITFFPTDYTRDTCFMAPYILENYISCDEQVYAMSFSSLSDIHEDFFNADIIFSGGPGLLTFNGIPKASYLALQMALNSCRNVCLKGRNFTVSKTDTGYEILIYNMSFYTDDYIANSSSVISFSKRYNVFESVPDLSVHIELPLNSKKCSITRTLLDRNHGSAYDVWESMGSPSDPTPEITDYLKHISIPAMSYEIKNVSGILALDEIMEPHSVIKIEIREM